LPPFTFSAIQHPVSGILYREFFVPSSPLSRLVLSEAEVGDEIGFADDRGVFVFSVILNYACSTLVGEFQDLKFTMSNFPSSILNIKNLLCAPSSLCAFA